MKPKQMMLFAVAIGCGLVAMIAAQQVLSGNKPPEQEMVKILVAKDDIAAGIPLDKSNVAFKDFPKDNLPEGAITKEEEFADHALKIGITKNMPVLLTYLGPKGQLGIASQIPKGMILVTLPVDSTMTHSGLLRPGSYVTISCAVSRPRGDGSQRESTTIKTVLKRAKVIAVGNQTAGAEAPSKDPNAARVENVSFVVFPLQAKLLYLAKEVSKGRMNLSLLGEEDKSTDDMQDMDESAMAAARSDLLGEKAAELLESTPKSAGVPAKQKPTGGNFSEYLKNQTVAPEVAGLGTGPSKTSIWRIEIWNGDKKDIHEVELTDEPVNEAASLPAEDDNQNQWAAPLMRFFSRKRTPKSDIEETQTMPSQEKRPESYNDKSAASPTDATRQ